MRLEMPRASRIGGGVALVAAVVLVAADAYAQKPAPPRTPTETDRANELLYERNRSLMHPGDPLLLMGREQGDNEMRARTPALAQGDRSIAHVDPAENYARALALYEDRATFHQPLIAVIAAPEGESAPAPATEDAPKAVVHAPERTGSRWVWLLALGLPVGLFAWLFVRAKPPDQLPRHTEIPSS
jgi:hypothetical protein